MDTGPLFPANRFMLDTMNFAPDTDGTVMLILDGVAPGKRLGGPVSCLKKSRRPVD